MVGQYFGLPFGRPKYLSDFSVQQFRSIYVRTKLESPFFTQRCSEFGRNTSEAKSNRTRQTDIRSCTRLGTPEVIINIIRIR